MYHLGCIAGWGSAVASDIIQQSHYGNRCPEETLHVLGGSRMSLGLKKYCQAWRLLNARHVEISEYNHVLHLNCPFALPFLGGAVASKSLQRQLAAHLCELEPEGRSLAGLPGGKAEGRGSHTGSGTSHQTRGSAHTGAGAGECTIEGMKGWIN